MLVNRYGYHVYSYIILVIFMYKWIGCQSCSFPPSYRGMWYQEGLGKVNITTHEFTKKGRCHRVVRGRYVIHDRERQCFRCMVFTKQHLNILQYKESLCLDKNQRVCQHMSLHSGSLYTLVSERAEPIPCIFEGSSFFYYEKDGILCDRPYSNLIQCASESHYKFHFKFCRGFGDFSELSDYYNFRCLATWKSGGNYLFGEFDNPITQKKSYRCFLYTGNGLGLTMAMSRDESCMGLVNIQDSSMILQIARSIADHPDPQCEFPDWLSDKSWLDLSGRYTFVPNADKNSLRISYLGKPKELHRCFSIDRLSTTTRLFQTTSFSTIGCQSYYQCIRFLRRNDNVVEFHAGEQQTSEAEACDEDNFSSASKYLLIPIDLPGTPCPFDGRYKVDIQPAPGSRVTCRSLFTSGCEGSFHLKVEISSCPIYIQAAKLKCLSFWTRNRTTYVIARRQGGGISANCFSFRKHKASMNFALDHACNMGAPTIMERDATYTLKRIRGSCKDTVLKKNMNGKNASGIWTYGNAVEPNYLPGQLAVKTDENSAFTKKMSRFAPYLVILLLLNRLLM